MKRKSAVLISIWLGMLALLAFPQPASAGTIKVNPNGMVINKKGWSIMHFRGKDGSRYFTKKQTISYYKVIYKNGKRRTPDSLPAPYIYKGWRYWSLGNGYYVRDADVDPDNDYKSFVFKDEERYFYVYNRKGQRVIYKGQKHFLAGMELDSSANNGQYYYYWPTVWFYVGDGGYVDGNEVIGINGKPAITLKRDCYLYDAQLKKVGSKQQTGQFLPYYGKVTKADHGGKYFYYYNYSKRRVLQVYKGQYLQVGINRYVKITDVDTIEGAEIMTNAPIIATVASDVYAYDRYLRETNHLYKKGSKIKLDWVMRAGDGDFSMYYYHVAKTKDYIEFGGDQSNNPSESSGYLKIANHSEGGCNYLEGQTETTAPKGEKKIHVYDLTGKPIKGKKIKDSVHVDGKFYLKNPQTKKVELYYHLQDQHLIERFFKYEMQGDEEEFKKEDQYNGFVKASDVYKEKLPVIITKEVAATNNDLADASDEGSLKAALAKVKNVKNTTAYKLSDQEGRDYFDYALKNAQQVMFKINPYWLADSVSHKQASSTKVEVTFAKWLLNDAKKHLDGKKAPVNDINNLGDLEAKRIVETINHAAVWPYFASTYNKGTDNKWHEGLDTSWISNSQSRILLRHEAYNKRRKSIKLSDYAENNKDATYNKK